jgi:hypothetical protein
MHPKNLNRSEVLASCHANQFKISLFFSFDFSSHSTCVSVHPETCQGKSYKTTVAAPRTTKISEDLREGWWVFYGYHQT